MIQKMYNWRVEEGRSLEFENLIEFGAFDEVHEMPYGRKAHDMVWVGCRVAWRQSPIKIVLSTVQS